MASGSRKCWGIKGNFVMEDCKGCISYDMHPLYFARERFSCAWERKRVVIGFAVLFLICAVIGMFVGDAYHLQLCTRYLRNVCYTENSVIVVFFGRFAGCSLLILFLLAAGMHRIGLVFPPLLFAFRGYTFGGCIVVFFSVYRFAGALIVITFYLPVHLLVDLLLLWATALSADRCQSFCFCRASFFALLRDAALLIVLAAAVCVLEMVLLLVIVHPVGNLM